MGEEDGGPSYLTILERTVITTVIYVLLHIYRYEGHWVVSKQSRMAGILQTTRSFMKKAKAKICSLTNERSFIAVFNPKYM